MAIQQRQPTAIGSASNWQLGAGVDSVDAVDDTLGANDGDTTYIYITVNGQRHCYTCPVFNVPAGATINSVTLRGLFKFVGTSAMVLLNIRNEASGISEGSGQAIASSASYGEILREMTFNPFTVAEWTVDQVNGEGSTANRIAEIEVRSVDLNTAARCTQFWIEVDYTEMGAGLNVLLG